MDLTVKATGIGCEDRVLTEDEVRSTVSTALDQVDVAGKRVLVIIPDHTRTVPLGPLFRLIYEGLAQHAKKLDYLIALGTHPPMSEEMIWLR